MSDIAYAHHEMYDGSGYPGGIKANEITPLARIMMAADSFDAMTTNRIYKGRKSVDEAVAELQALSKGKFHLEVIEVAVDILKNITVDNVINQLPKNEIDEIRFAYFYKDNLTKAYKIHHQKVEKDKK